jgi:hypothetical protein
MSVATLLTGALKTPQTGAQEAQPASVEPPEKLFPARTKLDKVLTDYEKASTDLDDSRGHLARAETDEQSALNNLELSDEESADRVAVAQRNRGIYGARVANREAAQAKLLKELKDSLNPAHHEHSALVVGVFSKWLDILRGRVMTAGRIGDGFSRDVDVLLENSALIQEIRSLQINSGFLLFCDSPEQITGMARKILAGYEAIAAKQKEQV